ncbi:MAG: FAD:protein FMN transferase [Bacteroidetes bacterium]|nr:FAD:protein FMN transferase [Bacteroidota bacterium]
MRIARYCLLMAFLPALTGSRQEYHIEGHAQGTTYHITYFAADSLFTQRQADSIFAKLDSSLSGYKAYSLISRFNASSTGIDMDEHLQKVIRRSMDIWRDTRGESDITVAPLVQAWGFGPRPAAALPDSVTIKKILQCTGARLLHIQGNKLVKDKPCVTIDVNGIAQGYSVDVIAGFLERRGVHDYLAEVGGEIRVSGYKSSPGDLFTIGIEGPSEDRLEEPIVQKRLSIGQGAITTSGNYRKFYNSGNKIISHLIEPHTGYPIQNEMISVTVLARDAITADGYDNALMGMGLRKALLFMKRHPEMQAWFIYRKPDGTISDTATAGFRRRLK